MKDMKDMEELVESIRRAAASGRSEEDLKMAMEPRLQEYLKAADGVTVSPTYEVRTGLAGRRDAVYGHFTLEYKRPGYLNNERNCKRAAQQLAEYLETVAGEAGSPDALKRVAGACTDGRHIFFLRYWPRELIHARPVYAKRQLSLFGANEAPGGFQMLGPFAVNKASLQELLRYLRALGRKPLVAEALAEVFGPGSDVAQDTVGALYRALGNTSSQLVQALYKQWEQVFGVVYGAETSKAEKDVPELAQGYGLPQDAALKSALFAVHTYFALIMKLLAAEILALQEGALTPSLLSELLGLEGPALKERLTRLESGEDYQAYGIRNFLEGDFFQWYLPAWEEPVGVALQGLVQRLADFEPTTPTLQPSEARDLLKKLYQYLVPKKLRHDLGEYYTPDWLAERLLNQLGYDGNPEVRLLDPACGSGTFLTLALARVRAKMEFEMWDRDPVRRRECAAKALQNVVGFDLNPLAVLAARTNYLLAFGDLLRDVRPVEIPVYNCDSVLTPVLQKQAQMVQQRIFGPSPPDQSYFFLPTTEGEFRIPKAVLEQKALSAVTAIMEESVAADYATEEFLARVAREVDLDDGARAMLGELYGKLVELERQGKNGVWVRLLKNSFAPVLQKPFDLVVGNPPWVNWEHLPESWRELSKDLWVRYGLFSLKGHAARLGGGKKDLAMLFTYACADYYLKPKGQLGFVITQTVFKTKGAGDGFRRFQLGENGLPLRVKVVDDLSDLQPFEGATNRTAILTLIKGQPTRYPVPYTVWQRQGGQRIPPESTLEEASRLSRRRHYLAEPVEKEKPTSPWITANRYVLSALRKVIGPSAYRAYAGAYSGGLNGVYWVRILEHRPDGLVVIENLGNVGKKKVPVIRAAVEPDLLYPLLRGRDIAPWSASPSVYILLTQNPETRLGWDEEQMKTEWPHTYRYFKQFEPLLWQRKSSGLDTIMKRSGFYAMYAVGPYTLAPYKVVWKSLALFLQAAVVVPQRSEAEHSLKPVIPEHNTMFIPCSTLQEAHYLCALLNSSVSSLFVRSYIAAFYSSHVLTHLAIPRFSDGNTIHQRLVAASKEAQQNPTKASESRYKIDNLAAELWDLSDRELRAVQRELSSASAQILDG